MKYVLAFSLLSVSNQCLAKELIVVGANWCRYCVEQKQYLQNNPKVIEGFTYEYIDIDKNPELIDKLNIKVYPTSFIFDDNKKIGELKGFSVNRFKQWINKYEKR